VTVSTRAAPALVSLALAAFWPACRGLTLCKGEACENATINDGGAGAGSDAGETGDAGASGNPHTGEGGSSGAGGRAEQGEAGEAQVTTMSCEGGRAECDGSPLTHCETQPSFEVRHCGGCERACNGACVLGRCKPATRVFTGLEARYFVATHTDGYALFPSRTGDDSALVMFDMDTGAAEVAMEGVADTTTLTLGADALYLEDYGEVHRVAFDGKLLAKEDVGEFTSFVATLDGIYLLKHDDGEADGVAPTWSLWYRENRELEFEQLWQSERETWLESWSSYGLVLLEDDTSVDTDEQKFTLVNERYIRSLGTPPAGWHAVIPHDGVAAVLAVGEDGEELWWLREGVARRRELRVPSVMSTLLLGTTGIWLHLNEKNTHYLVEFDEDGSAGPKIGLPYNVNPIFMSTTHVWYSDADWLFDPSHLMRAEQLSNEDY
jgi:hypothetical protein